MTRSAKIAHRNGDADRASRTEFIELINAGMTDAKRDGNKATVYLGADRSERANQYCFFLKPGVAETHPLPSFSRILEVVLADIDAHELRIDELHVLAGPYLARNGIMKHHYGILDRLARDAAGNMTVQMRRAFRDAYGVETVDADVLGGFEFLERFPDVSVVALDFIWANVEHERLASGCFCGRIKVANHDLYVVNGFTPRQLSTYTAPDIAIPVFILSGDRPWPEMRENFVGTSDPAEAAPGSIRNQFFVRRKELGIKDVSIATNGSHLSAGPVEALVELQRFTADAPRGDRRALSTFQFGRKLASRFSADEIAMIVGNATVDVDGIPKSIFDLTEGADEAEALDTLLALRRRPA